MKREKAIEIPFGAKDSELIKWEYTIPEGMEAEIKDGKVIINTAESEYERIRKKFVEYHSQQFEKNRDQEIGLFHKDALAYLEKQKELDKMIVVSPEVWDKAIADAYENGKKDGEKQKEQKPAEWTLPKDFEEAVYKVANFISPFDSQEELRKVSHRFAEQLLSLAKKELDKPAEWSEEDEAMRADTLKSLRRYQLSMPNYQVELQIRWLKSLRPSWKPSEEQMSALDKAIPVCMGVVGRDEVAPLESLYEDLKKL